MAHEAETVAYRIKNAVGKEKFKPRAGEDVFVTVSIGVTQYLPTEDITAFVKRADAAMYASKDEGRDKVSCLFAD